MTPRELAERAESAAPEQQRELLAEAVWALLDKTRWGEWHMLNSSWNRLLNIGTDEAFTAAAMMMVPEGCFYHISRFKDGSCEAHIYPDRCVGDDYCSEAATLALAILAAVAKARSTQGGLTT